ncbi:MAG: hypothetical protein ACKVOP_13210 [Sphingomonadaceae bacterium]
MAPAHATCSVANQYRFEFGTAAATGLSYASSYSYAATSTALGSQNFTVSWPIVNGASSTVVATLQMPRIDPIINDGNPTTANNLIVGMILAGRTADITSGTNVVVTRFTFPTAIRTFSVQLNDIDFATNQFRDWIHISGSNGATVYSPSISTPAGNNNTSGPRTAPGSTINLGAAATPFIMTDREAIGNGTAPNTDDTGTLTAVFAQPITQVEIRYGNNGVSPGGGTTGQQAYGIQRVSWCPMPVLSVIKTSAPFSDPANGTTDPKLIPGGDLLYTITVNNADSSPVDLNGTVITDPLPGTVTFYNADIDDAGPLTTNFAFNAGTSGLSFGAANFTYSNNGGATYAYAPAPGYDPAVNALRFAPTGSMAANSSFSVQFRVRIR